MRTSNGQSVCLTNYDGSQVSKVKRLLFPSQAELLDLIMFEGVLELSKSLHLIHDLALFHSDTPFDEVEKSALFHLKVLWEGLEKIAGEI